MTAARYPFDRLEALIAVELDAQLNSIGQPASRTRLVAEVLGVDQRQVHRWRQIGVTADQADRLAVRAHHPPLLVWPELFDECTRPCARPACTVRFVPSKKTHKFCSRRCKRTEASRLNRARRYKVDPDYVERCRVRNAAYYAECAEAVKAKARARRSRRVAA